MFDFNNVIENNNIIDNIQLNLLDINVVFFNCYKLLINTGIQDNNWHVIFNLVGRFEQTESNHNNLITHEIFESLLNTEFKYTGMLKNKNSVLVDVYISKYFIVHVTKNIFNSVYPSKVLIKFNDNIDTQDLVKVSDISEYNNALDDIKRVGCTDLMSYVRFMDIMEYSPEYTIGDNVLDTKFDKYCRNDLSNLQEDYNDSSIFYMDKTNSKFYFILAPYILRRMSAYSFASIINCSSAYHLIYNNLSTHETNSEKFLIYKRKDYPFYLDTKYDKREINVTITDNVHNTTIPDYILRKYVNYDDIRKEKIGMHDYRIIIVEPC